MDEFTPFLLNFQKKETSPFKTLGYHLLMKCYGCDRAILNDVEQVIQAMRTTNPIPCRPAGQPV